jgi:hypothetical protein
MTIEEQDPLAASPPHVIDGHHGHGRAPLRGGNSYVTERNAVDWQLVARGGL